jgi:hypothetical protein
MQGFGERSRERGHLARKKTNNDAGRMPALQYGSVKVVIPAKAGIHERHLCNQRPWIPAFAGMTNHGAVRFTVNRIGPRSVVIEFDSWMPVISIIFRYFYIRKSCCNW